MLELQLMKARQHHSIYHLQFAPMFQKSSFFFGELTHQSQNNSFWRIDTLFGTGDVGHCIDQIRERLAPKDGIERRQSLQAPEAAVIVGGWVKGKFSHGEITRHIFLESRLRCLF